MTLQERIALSNALIRAVRKYLFFTPNIEKLWKKDEEHNNLESLRNIKLMNVIDARGECGFIFSSKKNVNSYALSLLKSNSSTCGDLTKFVCNLLVYFIKKNKSNIIGTVVVFGQEGCCDGHAIVIIHNSRYRLIKSGSIGFADYCASFSDNEAVICDPWIWKTTPIKEYQRHIEYAKRFEVEAHYSRTNLYEVIANYRQQPYEEVKGYYSFIDLEFNALSKSFDEIYAEELLKDIIPLERSYSSVRKSLDGHAQIYLVQQQLLSFVRHVKASSSIFYSNSDRKGKALNQIIDFCNNSINELLGIKLNTLVFHILKTTISIALISRGNIKDISQIQETKTAQAALEALKSNDYKELRKLITMKIESYDDLLNFVGVTGGSSFFNDEYKSVIYSSVDNLDKLIE